MDYIIISYYYTLHGLRVDKPFEIGNYGPAQAIFFWKTVIFRKHPQYFLHYFTSK